MQRTLSREARPTALVRIAARADKGPAGGGRPVVEVASSPKLPMAQAAPSDAPSKHLGPRLEVHHRSVRRSGSAHIVIAASSARFKLPEASIGVFVTGGLTATLAAYAGLARAKALMLLGDEFSPTQALEWGLVWRVVAPDELASVSRRMAEQIASLRPEVVSQYKRVLNAVGMPNFHRAIELECEAQRAIAGQQVSPG